MASFRKRSGSWQARVKRKNYPDIAKSFGTKIAAQDWARQVESQINLGIYDLGPQPEDTTLGELLHRYLENITPYKKGFENETYRINAWLRHPLAKRLISTIRGPDFATWRDKRLKSGVGASTIRKDLSIISNLYNIAKTEWGFETIVNPIQSIRAPKLPRGRDRRLLSGELQKLMEALEETHEIKIVVQLALETGMRRAELLSIEWRNIDLENRFLILPDTKNGESRAVPLSTKALNLIQAVARTSTGSVFVSKPNSVTQGFVRACKRAGLEDLRFHDLRHEATSRFFELGLNTMEVSAITGHKTLSMLKRYTHLKAKDLALKLG